MLDHDRVVAAVGRWSFIPAQAERFETEEYQVLRLPPWWAEPLEVRWLTPRRSLDEVLDDVVERCRSTGLPRACCWVRMDAPSGYEQALMARGARLDETLDVLARALDGPIDLEAPRDVDLRWDTDLATFGDVMRVGGEVFGGEEVDDDQVAAEFAGESGKVVAGAGGSVVAYLDGRAVGTAGLTMAGPDARLWGGAVLPHARGRGVYRALLGERFAYAVRHGADLALVKARVDSSAPTLRRAGFEKVGQERSYLLDL